MNSDSRVSKGGFGRRRFLSGSAAAVAAAAIVPRHVVAQSGQTPPSEKLNIAGVGIGGKGYGDLKEVSTEAITALCDVDAVRGDRAFKQYPDARRYVDYREMFDKEKDLDGVIVATPDHMHFPIAMAAIKHGLNVYCQKPLTHTVWESRELAQAADEKKVATQMGNQGLAADRVRRIKEWLDDGCIGDVQEVHIWTDRPVWPQGIDRPKETPPVPNGLDWDKWLGIAPARPYHPLYHPFRWRGWLDFGTGALGDIGCHSFAPVFRVLELGHPDTVEAYHSEYMSENWKPWGNEETYPRASIVYYDFPATNGRGPIRLTWYDGGLKPRRPSQLEDGRSLGKGGTMYVGTKGVLLNGRLIPETRMKAYKQPPATLPRSIGHYKEWLAACRGGKPAWSEFGFAGLVTQAVLLGNVALRTGTRIKWDGEAGVITNNQDANALLKRPYRDDWVL